MRTKLQTLALAALALALSIHGVTASSVDEWVRRVLVCAGLDAPGVGVVTPPATEALIDEDRELLLSLVNAHRRGASEAWCAKLAEAIYHESTLAEVDPLMVASIVAKESSFRSRVVSHAGAVGLMQLRPFVARDIARRGKIEWHGIQTLHSPDLNVRLGILYYKELVERFDGDQQVALTAYNQGPTRVSRNLKRGTYAGSSYADEILDMYEALRNPSGEAET